MISFAMDGVVAISLGFALRLVIVAASHYNDRVGGSLVGLWEGAVLYHFLEKWPMSFDPYVGLGFRLLVDFLFTESLYRLAIVLLWTGLGFILADVTPAFWYDKNLHRFYRRTRRFIRHFDWNSLKFPLPSGGIPRVRFFELPPRSAPDTSPPPATRQRRHSVPGNFPESSHSSSDTSGQPSGSDGPRRPIPATSLPPSALRSVSQPKPSSNSSVSFDIAPRASDVDNDSFKQLATEGVPTPKPLPPMPPVIVMPTLVHPTPDGQPTSAEPVSSTLVAGNIDLLPEITEPHEDSDPPPPFVEQEAPITKATGGAPARTWVSEKLSVRNPDISDIGSARSSIISGGNRDSIIGRAEMLRKQAAAEEKERDRLHAEHKKAFSERRYPDAIRYKVEQDEANERAMNLHRRAAERYFKGAFPSVSFFVLEQLNF